MRLEDAINRVRQDREMRLEDAIDRVRQDREMRLEDAINRVPTKMRLFYQLGVAPENLGTSADAFRTGICHSIGAGLTTSRCDNS
jgi:hypothetical protein